MNELSDGMGVACQRLKRRIQLPAVFEPIQGGLVDSGALGDVGQA